jgi:hypothetical protein
MITTIKPPHRRHEHSITDAYTIFVGGSIEMGKAVDWQFDLHQRLNAADPAIDAVLFNPRRNDWDATQPQDPTPGTQFEQQVTWELDHLESADLIVFNFIADTISPITLLELGMNSANSKDVIVCCPRDYFRYGNVKILCERSGITITEDYEELCNLVIQRAQNHVE